jgi:hypothetical protein
MVKHIKTSKIMEECEIVTDFLWGIGVNSENRFAKFMEFADTHLLTQKQWWYGFRVAYEGSDNLYDSGEEIREILSWVDDFSYVRELMMEEEEIEYFNSLPDKLTIHRGMTVDEFNSGNFGVSWSLDKEVAEYFAYTYPRNHSTQHLPKMVHSVKIKKDKVIALLRERDENEIIILL